MKKKHLVMEGVFVHFHVLKAMLLPAISIEYCYL